MPRAPILALAGVLAALAALPATAAAQDDDRVNVRVGMGDQNIEMFDNPDFQALEMRQVRYFMKWDIMEDETQRLAARAYIKKAIAEDYRPLIHLSTNNFESKKAERPSIAEYNRNVNRVVRYFRKLGVRDFGTWNEANHSTQPTFDSPNHAALYFKDMWEAVRSTCTMRSCRVVALDVLDQGGVERYIARFYNRLDRLGGQWTNRARFVGVHNYSDVNRFRNRGLGGIIDEVERHQRDPVFWLTETGGQVGSTGPDGDFFCDPNETDRSDPNSKTQRERFQVKALNWLFKQAETYERFIDRVYLYNWQGEDCRLGEDTRNGGQRTVFDAGLIRSSQDPTTRPGYDVVKEAMDEEFKR
ncbi:MAG: hypothetical protein MSC31_00840 [Solirubrobacteraceae bacterium MAG38_C4-C5]|nr:hypothetical protein [Candidatus Siliceabacter maunaloa]